MQKRTREIIALVLLIVLGVGGVSAAAWYILVGHNWNAAATSIDDRIGSMEGYTVILCEGSIPSLDDQRRESAAQPMLEQQNLAEPDATGRNREAAHMSLDDAIESYREKGAQVLIVHCDDPSSYADPVIAQRNGKRFAVFSVSGPRADLAARAKLKEMRRYDLDFTICLIGEAASASGLGQVDLAICTSYDEAGSEGRSEGSAYVMGCPFTGQVGAVIVAPSGFITSKMLEVS